MNLWQLCPLERIFYIYFCLFAPETNPERERERGRENFPNFQVHSTDKLWRIFLMIKENLFHTTHLIFIVNDDNKMGRRVNIVFTKLPSATAHVQRWQSRNLTWETHLHVQWQPFP